MCIYKIKDCKKYHQKIKSVEKIGILLFTDAQKLYAPEISQLLLCMLQVEILWMSSQLIVQWNYVTYFQIRGLFGPLVTQISKHISANKVLLEKSIFFYRLFILFIRKFSFLQFLYSVSLKQRDYLHASIDILF